MKHIIFTIAASLLTLGTASAADLATQPVEPVAPAYLPFSWSGFYVGAQAGYAWGTSSYTVPVTAYDQPLDPNGFFGGVHAGYNYEFPSRILIGLEGDVNFGDTHSTKIDPIGNTLTSKLDWSGSLRARVGYAWDRFLPYITGGLAVGDFKHSVSGILPLSSWSDTYVGWTVGAGLEYAFTDYLTARIEYRYSDYGKQSFPLTPSGRGFWTAHDVDLKTSDVRIGITYKF